MIHARSASRAATHRLGMLAGLAVCSAAAMPALAQTITVNWSQDDSVDFGGAQRVSDLPGPDGLVTFAEAVIAANNTAGPQTIVFAVPRADWWTLFGNDVCIFAHQYMAYVSGDDTTIDFTTQTAFTGDTNPAGNEVGFYYAGPPSGIPNIWLAGNRITVKGLDRLLGNNFDNGLWITGNDCRVIGCTTTGMMIRGDYGGGARNVIGGAGPGEGNTFASPVNILSHANQNVIIGNAFRYGLRVSGDTYWGLCEGTRIGGAAAGERNIFAGHGFVGEEGLPLGVELEIYYASNTLVQGNLVGTSDDGMARFPGRTGVEGIAVGIGAVQTTIVNNTVAGIARTGSNHYQGQRFGVGIGVGASATGTRIEGNRIGLSVDGATGILNVQGIVVASDPNGLPGATRLEGNWVSTSERMGVLVLGEATGVTISGNSIFGNGGMGIDLGGAGVTFNDAGDVDGGANGQQNFPVITSAQRTAEGVEISGTLESAPSRVYRIECFADDHCDDSGFGEGRWFLGAVDVVTNGAGSATFSGAFPTFVPEGWITSATATEAASGNTSEFSACFAMSGRPCLADFDGSGFVDTDDFGAFVAAFIDGGEEADFDGSGFVDTDDYDAFVGAFEAGC